MTYSGKFECRSTSAISNSGSTAPTVASLGTSFNILNSATSRGSSLSAHSSTAFHGINASLSIPTLCLEEKEQTFLSNSFRLGYSSSSGSSVKIGSQLGADGVQYYSAGMIMTSSGVNSLALARTSGTGSSTNTVSSAKDFNTITIVLKD
jgi:hypothetical protein